MDFFSVWTEEVGDDDFFSLPLAALIPDRNFHGENTDVGSRGLGTRTSLYPETRLETVLSVSAARKGDVLQLGTEH